MKVNVFAAKCITNLHVGNGDVNYNIIDQEVEKDPVTGHPIINSSGVKGAIREFIENKWDKKDPDKKNKIDKIFGFASEKSNEQGSYKFLQADMLFRPLRVSDNSKMSFVLSTTEEIIELFSERVKGLNGELEGINAFTDDDKSRKVKLEDTEVTLKTTGGKWSIFTKKPIAIVGDINRYDLPVIARNALDDSGISQNLWYEEFVPHESIFGIIILTPNEMDPEFKAALTSEPVQFGGNASIGYGLMEIREVR